jgi:hypothetical protein
MRLGWKVFLPVSLGFVVVVSGYLMFTRYDNAPHVALCPSPDNNARMARGAAPVGVPCTVAGQTS